MFTPRTRSRRLFAAAALCLSPALALSAVPAAYAEPDTSAIVASGDGWFVEPAAGGYQLTLELDEPLPIVNDAPALIVDGENFGYAAESEDGLSLSVFTTDSAVLDAEVVTSSLTSGDSSEADAVSPSEADAVDDAAKSMQSMADDVAAANDPVEDPSTPGAYTVNELEYDFGNQAVALSGIGGIRGEMTGKMYLTDAPGSRPTVILLHGRHTSCSGSGANPLRWPCGATQRNIRSYQGYEGTARALATHGYNVVSIAANAINSNDNQFALDYGARARGQLILDTLDMLGKASAGTPITMYDAQTATDVTLDQAFAKATTRTDFPSVAPATPVTAASLVGRFDLTNVGMMGHSRGGEGVTAAVTLNDALEKPYGFTAVLPLAPVDYGRMTLPDVPTAIFLPYCDGDVEDQLGQHILDDSRHAFDDNILRSAVWIMGTNHNFFNTVWTPGLYPAATSDDWSTSDRTSSCSTTSSTRLTAAQQYQVGVSYMTGFFRLAMGGESKFQPLYDGTTKPSTTSTAAYADVRIVASQPHSSTSLITDFATESSLVRAYGTGTTAQVCTNTTGRTVPQSLPYCTITKSTASVPHWAPVAFALNTPSLPLTKLQWTSSAGELRVTLPKEKRDVSAYSQLTVKVAPEEKVVSGTDFTIRVVDGKGATYSTLASAINPLAINRLPGGHDWLNKVVLQQLTIPTSALTGIDLTDIREVRFLAAVGADATAAGGLYLSDLVFESPSLGTSTPQNRPTVNVVATSVEEGKAPDYANVAVELSRPAAGTVTTYVTAVGSATGRAGVAMEPVVFAPGETCKAVAIPTLGDSTASTTASTRITINATVTTGAVMGADAFNSLTVREDDGLTNSTAPLPAVGVQGDACAEAAAARTPGSLTLSQDETAPGGTLTATGSGFRAGESVLFSYGSTELGRVLADATGSATSEILVPQFSPSGVTAITAKGAGSAFSSTADVSVLTDTETALTLDPEVPAIKEPVTLKATVTGADTAGTVTFADGETELGTAETVEGVATFELEDGFAAGEHTVSAAFGATDTARGSESEPVSFTLEKSASTLVLGLSSSSTTFGSGVTASATLEGSAVGTVRFTYGSVTTDVEAVDGGATLALPATLKPGSYAVTAAYLGSDTVEPSATASADLTIAKKATSTALKLTKTTVKKGATVTGTVTVKGAVAGINPTGTVKIYSGSTVIREMKLSTASNGSIKISFKAPSSKGSITTKVTFVGDGNYAASSSARYSVKITG